jgi:hypothetical protein
MKRLSILIIAALISFPAICQNEKLEKLEQVEMNKSTIEKIDTADKIKHIEKQDTVVVEVGDEVFSVREMGDETRVKIGKKEFRVVENNDGVVVFRNTSKGNHDISHRRSYDRFKGHLGGLEFGFNGFLTDFWSTTLNPGDSYFDLYTAKSSNFGFLLPCINLGFTRHLGIAASVGMDWNTYRFDGNNSIVKDADGVVGPYYPYPPVSYSKSKLNTTFATLPVILEAQIPVSGSRSTINIGAGVIGALKLGSNTKVIYYNDGKKKGKNKDDFSINPLRWGATARVGYDFFQVYGTCYFTSMFEKGKGPELYPFEVGIAFTLND